MTIYTLPKNIAVSANRAISEVSHSRETQRGTAVVLVALVLVVLLGFAALAIDVGRLVVAKQELQVVADAAALAGAARLRQGMDVGPTTQAAVDVGSGNAVLGESLTLDPDQDVQVGAWDSETEQIVPWSPAFTDAVVGVTARRAQGSAEGPVPMIFAGLFGLESVDVTAWAGSQRGRE